MQSKISVYLTGNTVTLEAFFTDVDGNPIDIQNPKVVIYDYKYNKITEFPLSDSNRKSMGNYFYNYTTNVKPAKVIYEVYGELNGYPILDRKEFITKFIN